MKTLFLAFFLLCLPALTLAQTNLKAGTYTTEDGSYSIDVRYDAKSNTITIVEPNKTSNYTAVGRGEYGFTNPKNGIEYRLAILNATTLEAFKPGGRASSTKLYFSGGADEPAPSKDVEKYEKIAQKYLDKMESDSDDAQLWSFCAAAATARGTMNADGFESYATKIVKGMVSIMEDKTINPCDDAIPASIWNKASSED